jgi:hypothetical protein
VNVVPTTLTVSVGVGIALLRHVASAGTYDSTFQWLEHDDIATVDLTSLVDGANPRWAVIEIAPNDTAEVTSLRDIFNPALGTFTAQSVDKVRGSSPTLTVRAGAADASPVLPSGQAGVIPLAYVYLPAGATELTPGDHIMCRPLLGKPSERPIVSGGGLSIESLGGSAVRIHECTGRLPGLPREIGVVDSAGLDLDVAGDPAWIAGQAFPSDTATIALYLYAAAAPYPSGYDSGTAPREMVPGINIGPGARVPSLPAAIADSVRECLVVATKTAPANPRDLQSSDVEGLAVNDPMWGDGVLGPAVYMGAVTYATGGDLLGRQDYMGNGEVRWRAGSSAPIARESNVLDGAASGVSAGDWRRVDPLSDAGDVPVPSTALAGHLRLELSAASPTVNRTISIVESDGAEIVAKDGLASEATDVVMVWLHGADGAFSWEHVESSGTGDSTILFSIVAYRDAILAAR